MLNSLIENPDLEESETFRGLALEAERRKELALAETKSVSNVLLDLFLDEMDSAMKTIGDRYGETRTIRSIQNSVPIKANNTNTIDLVVRQGTDVPIWLHQDSNFSIHARFIPARAARNYFQESTDYPFITMNLRGDNKDSKQVLQQIIWYFDSRTTLKVWTKDATTIHQERHFIEVLTGILDHCVS